MTCHDTTYGQTLGSDFITEDDIHEFLIENVVAHKAICGGVEGVNLNLPELACDLHGWFAETWNQACDEDDAATEDQLKRLGGRVIEALDAGEALLNGKVTFDTLRWRAARDRLIVELSEALG
jgi:hypothetical protein